MNRGSVWLNIWKKGTTAATSSPAATAATSSPAAAAGATSVGSKHDENDFMDEIDREFEHPSHR